jgi:DNA-binding winged helix-turn-helix (wHTH) protein
MDPVNSSFHINGIEVIPDAGLIRTASGEHRLPVRLMKLLCLLVDAQGATVDREKLVDALWPRGFVNEEALSKAIAELRRHLGDDARAPRFIETVPKRGYRMVASPTPNPPAHSTAARSRRLLPLFGVLLVLAGSTAFYFFTARDSVVTPAISASAIQLTADSEMQYHPELSPDGQWLAFIRNETGSGQLNIMPAVGLTESRVISGDLSIWSPTFSPDAGKLAVASLDEDSCTILEILINNAAIQPLGSCKLPSNSPILDWSSDGTKLAYVDKAAGSEHAAIWQMRLSDGQRRQLTKPPDEYSFDTRPRYSADGTTLSFTRGTRASRDLWLLDLTIPDDGSLPEPRRLTFDNQFTTGHDWRDDGNGIVLDSERSGFKALWEVDLDGRWSLLGARDAQSPTLAGNKMVFKISQYESNIW